MAVDESSKSQLLTVLVPMRAEGLERQVGMASN